MCRVTNEALHQVLAMVKAAPEDQGVIQKLEQYIADFGNSNLKYELISAYRKYSPNINTSLIFKYLNFTKDPMVVGLSIEILSKKIEIDCNAFWKVVFDIAKGVEWDVDREARLPAIFVLEYCKDVNSVKKILALCFRDENSIIRDVSAITLQRCMGIRRNLIKTYDGIGDDMLTDASTIKWLEISRP